MRKSIEHANAHLLF